MKRKRDSMDYLRDSLGTSKRQNVSLRCRIRGIPELQNPPRYVVLEMPHYQRHAFSRILSDKSQCLSYSRTSS